MNYLFKRFLKLSSVLACAAVLVVGAVSLSACATSTNDYYGEYSYANPWSESAPDYGIKVKVTVQSDNKGYRIKSAETVESEYTEVSEDWSGKSVWESGVNELLSNYRGKYIEDVIMEPLKINAESAPGQPESVADSGYVISGATQSSGRLLLAVQKALMKAAEEAGYSYAEGEYKYANAWGEGYYGIKVRVLVKDGKIEKVRNDPYAGYIEVSSGWDDKAIWTDNIDGLLKKYEGRTVEDVLAATVTVSDGSAGSPAGQPESVSESELAISGATQGSGRLLLAVQNALKNLNNVL